MSGPKSSRYQLTPEQRKALAEARRREIKRKKGLLALSSHKEAVKASLKAISAYSEKADLLFSRDRSDLGFKEALSGFENKILTFIESITLSDDADLDTVEKALEKANEALSIIKEEEKALTALADKLEEALDSSINRALEITVSFADLDDEKALLEKRIAFRRTLLDAERDNTLPEPLRGEIREALIMLSDVDLKTFEALSFKPLIKKIDSARTEYAQYASEYAALRSEYEALCAIVSITPLPTDCSKEGVELLKRYVKTLSYEIAYDDEESYIGDVLDRVMREMGYHVLADRTVEKKSGKRFTHELYSYRDGTVVNVTTAADGKITMELGKPDRVDRLPSDTETDQLVREMEAFCHDFAEIEERLRANGVVVADRITMLPPTAEHAQIINIEDYAFRKESDADKKAAIAWQTRITKRRRVFRHIKTE